MKKIEQNSEALHAAVAIWAKKLRVDPKLVRVQSMKRCWGSCSSRGTLTLASDLIREDARFVDFVIVHELLHLKVPNHGKLFKALMTVHLPGWRAIEDSRRGQERSVSKSSSPLR